MHTKLHDRSEDDEIGFNDEMLYCLRPIIFSCVENLKFGIKADGIIIDGATKRYCSEYYDKRKLRNHDEELEINGIKTQIRFRALE